MTRPILALASRPLFDLSAMYDDSRDGEESVYVESRLYRLLGGLTDTDIVENLINKELEI